MQQQMKKLGYKPRQSDPRDSAVSHCTIPFSTNKVNIVPINVKWDSSWNFSEIKIYKQRRGNGLWGMSKRKRVFENNERKFNYFGLFLFWIFNCILKIKLYYTGTWNYLYETIYTYQRKTWIFKEGKDYF